MCKPINTVLLLLHLNWIPFPFCSCSISMYKIICNLTWSLIINEEYGVIIWSKLLLRCVKIYQWIYNRPSDFRKTRDKMEIHLKKRPIRFSPFSTTPPLKTIFNFISKKNLQKIFDLQDLHHTLPLEGPILRNVWLRSILYVLPTVLAIGRTLAMYRCTVRTSSLI